MQQQLLDVLAQSLGLMPKTENVKYSALLYEEAWKQGVLPLVLSVAPDDRYRQRGMLIMRHSMLVNAAHGDLAKVVTCPYVIIKGYASARYYPDPGLRTMGDVDYWVENLEQTKQDLLRHGYELEKVKNGHHTGYYKDGIRFELHWSPNGVLNDQIRQLLEDTIATAKVLTTTFGDIPVPDAFHHGLIVLLHMIKHMHRDAGIGLRQLCDWAVLVHRLGNDFESLFKVRLSKVGLYRSAQLFSLVCVKYLHLQYAPWMGEAPDEDLVRVMEDIISAGDLGVKDGGNRERVLAHETLLGATNRIIKNYWGIAEKCPLVLPFGWVYFGIRYYLKVFQGKRQDILQAMKGKKARLNLYNLFELPETAGRK